MTDDECPMCKLREELLTTQIRLTMAYAREGNKNFDKELEDAAMKLRQDLIDKTKKIEELEERIRQLESEKI